eukprot:2123096-Lingulodinium_polyedra.AAC.1
MARASPLVSHRTTQLCSPFETEIVVDLLDTLVPCRWRAHAALRATASPCFFYVSFPYAWRGVRAIQT